MPAVTQVSLTDFPNPTPCHLSFSFQVSLLSSVTHESPSFGSTRSFRFYGVHLELLPLEWWRRWRNVLALLLRSPPRWGSAPSLTALTSACKTVGTELRRGLGAGSGPARPCPFPPLFLWEATCPQDRTHVSSCRARPCGGMGGGGPATAGGGGAA